MPDTPQSFEAVTRRIRDFNAAREWGQFHSPRNIILALIGEAGELASSVQWVSDAEFPQWISEPVHRDQVMDEIADVYIYLDILTQSLGISLPDAVLTKIERNEIRYPADRVRGSAEKNTNR